jgi:hypothetical protein
MMMNLHSRTHAHAHTCTNAGFSNPYVVVKYGKQKYTTRTVFKNLNPRWREQVLLYAHPITISIPVVVTHDVLPRCCCSLVVVADAFTGTPRHA